MVAKVLQQLVPVGLGYVCVGNRQDAVVEGTAADCHIFAK